MVAPYHHHLLTRVNRLLTRVSKVVTFTASPRPKLAETGPEASQPRIRPEGAGPHWRPGRSRRTTMKAGRDILRWRRPAALLAAVSAVALATACSAASSSGGTSAASGSTTLTIEASPTGPIADN